MAKKSGLIEETQEEVTPVAKAPVEETPTETVEVVTDYLGYPSRDFTTPLS